MRHDASPLNDEDAGRPLAARGKLAASISRSPADVRAAQRLRYDVFYAERGLDAGSPLRDLRRDVDAFDARCDHILVRDGDLVVGTYRLLSTPPFYSEAEFDVAPLIARHGHLRFLELGRSCVRKAYRTAPVLELLWQAIWNHVRALRFDVLFGCASLPGTEPDALGAPLSFLAHRFAAPPPWQASARADRRVEMQRLAPGTYDERRSLRALPPLLRGYVGVGARVGDGAVVDRAFDTTDVMMILPVAHIDPRYFARFGSPYGPSR